jgi:polysaccharide export outer membrane protein
MASRLVAASKDTCRPACGIAAAIGLCAVLISGATTASAGANDYVVGPQDVLTITVWDQADLSGKFSVEADGTFTFPLIGRLQAGGLGLREIEAELRTRLADGFFKNPQISVAIEQYRSQRVFIVGEVRSPGTYALTGDMTLIEALSKAGSTTTTASGEAVIVRAKTDQPSDGPVLPAGGDPENIRVDLAALQSGARDSNIALRDGDTVYVPRADTIYVFGQVKNPGMYALQQNDITVLQALSLAGGVTPRGATNRIRVVRLVAGEKAEVKIKLGDVVRAGDTLIVPERFF